MYSLKLEIIFTLLALLEFTSSFHGTGSYDGINRNWLFEYGRNPTIRNGMVMTNPNGIPFHRLNNDWPTYAAAPVYYPNYTYKRFRPRYPPNMSHPHRNIANKPRSLFARHISMPHQFQHVTSNLPNRMPNFATTFNNLSHLLRTTKSTNSHTLPRDIQNVKIKQQPTPSSAKLKTTQTTLLPKLSFYTSTSNNCMNEGLNKLREIFFVYNNTVCKSMRDIRPTSAQNTEFVPLNKSKLITPTHNYEYSLQINDFHPQSFTSTTTSPPQNSMQALHYYFTIKDAITPYTRNKTNVETSNHLYMHPNSIVPYNNGKTFKNNSLRSEPLTMSSNNIKQEDEPNTYFAGTVSEVKNYNKHKNSGIFSFLTENEENTTKKSISFTTAKYEDFRTTGNTPVKQETDNYSVKYQKMTDHIATVATTQTYDITTTETPKRQSNNFPKSTNLINEELTTQTLKMLPQTTRTPVQKVYKPNNVISKSRTAYNKNKFVINNSTLNDSSKNTLFKGTSKAHIRPPTTPSNIEATADTQHSSTVPTNLTVTPTVSIKKFQIKKRYRSTPTPYTKPMNTSTISTTLAARQTSNYLSSKQRKAKPNRFNRTVNKNVTITKYVKQKSKVETTSESTTTSSQNPPQPKLQMTPTIFSMDITSNTPESAIMRISNSNPSKSLIGKNTAHLLNIPNLQKLKNGFVPELPIETYFKEVIDTRKMK